MKYRKIPKGKDKLSILGFGCMRFPTLENGKIDEDKSLAMLHRAYQKGVNYFDSAWPYHNGESEPFLGRFLAQIDRSTVYLATKLPCWQIKSREDMEETLEKQLERLNTNYIDYYLLHALNKRSWKQMKDLGVLDFLTKAKQAGKIRYAGFSFHDDYSSFKKIITAWDWDFTQIMLSFLDTHYQAGLKGMRLAAERGIGVISMEPLRGGKLIKPIPDEVEALWKNTEWAGKPASRALQWVWNHPECTVLLSGMSTMEQVDENLREANKAKAGSLSPKDLDKFVIARRIYIRRLPIRCTECRYCLPCPQNVSIPSALGIYSEAIMFGDMERHKREYQFFVPDANKADKCTQCGACLSKCPQQIDIPKWMLEIQRHFG
jgi:predicted aldo/keto reductase-like oxidoreductase